MNRYLIILFNIFLIITQNKLNGAQKPSKKLEQLERSQQLSRAYSSMATINEQSSRCAKYKAQFLKTLKINKQYDSKTVENALDYAIQQKHINTVKLLVEDKEIVSLLSTDSLHKAALSNITIFEILIQNDETFEKLNQRGFGIVFPFPHSRILTPAERAYLEELSQLCRSHKITVLEGKHEIAFFTNDFSAEETTN